MPYQICFQHKVVDKDTNRHFKGSVVGSESLATERVSKLNSEYPLWHYWYKWMPDRDRLTNTNN